VLDYKIIYEYILLNIENIRGMPYLKIIRNTSKDTTESWKFTANKFNIFSCDFNYVTPAWSKKTACCSGKQHRYLVWRNSTFRK